MKAGAAFIEEKNKPIVVNTKEVLRERKQFEKGLLLGSFKVVSFYDNLFFTKRDVINDKTDKTYEIIVPNYPVIKNNIENE